MFSLKSSNLEYKHTIWLLGPGFRVSKLPNQFRHKE